METSNPSTAVPEDSKPKANVPPTVITVDTKQTESANNVEEHTAAGMAASLARTPKHANKTKDDDVGKLKKHLKPNVVGETGSQGSQQQQNTTNPPSGNYGPPGRYPAPQRPFEGSMGGNGAFQPHDRNSFPQANGSAPRYYSSYSGGAPGRFNGAYDQQRYSGRDYHHQNGSNYQRGPPYGPPHPMYQHQQFAGNTGFDPSSQAPTTSWGAPQPGSFPQTRPPTYPNTAMPSDQYPSSQAQANNNGNTFSRAVSNSFDRSVKSRASATTDDKTGRNGEPSVNLRPAPPPGDSGSISEDNSWGALNQVHSVDEEELRKRVEKSQAAGTKKQLSMNQPHSNSSSLTNSPNPHESKKQAAQETSNKIPSSLDSLSSVASAQEPMDTNNTQGSSGQPKLSSSPVGSAASLDLMKCSSDSSGLLMPSHQTLPSTLSLPAPENDAVSKRERDEQRGDVETAKSATSGSENRRGASEDGRPTKKGRVESKDLKKASPLSIACSPPTSPGEKRKNASKPHQPMPIYGQKDPSPGQMDSFYDKPPSYAYSMDSAPPLPRETGQRPDGYPPLPPRPGSSSSSSITPMHVEGNHPGDSRAAQSVNQLPSWDIHPQDSFGGTSQGVAGGPLMSAFSFSQDYPMLSGSGSVESSQQQQSQQQQSQQGPTHQSGAQQGAQERGAPQQPLESRNQSFEGGHYHGSFSRSDSMMSYDAQGRPSGYQGPFPPQAPSWGSSTSYPPTNSGGYNQYRGNYPGMMRNYSEDSGRASPPPGPPGIRVLPPSFQPPPEFRAPPSMVTKAAPQNTHILTTPYTPGSKNGPYGWSKEEDIRLTEIMKKYKNPRDWEPIAKEHNRGRTSKECHERWIRYLKPGVRKGQWTDHEDAIVMEVVTTSTEQPFTRWSDLAQRLPGRVGKQIRDRWVNHLNPAINHLPFSREDDLLLWDGHKKLGKRWVEISTKYFTSSRSENHIKNRWYSASFKKFIANEFGPDAYSGGKPSKKDSAAKKKASIQRKQQANLSHITAV